MRVRRDESERPGRAGIAAAGDEHAAGAVEGGSAGRPVDVGQQRVQGAALRGRRGSRGVSRPQPRAAARSPPPRLRGAPGRGCGTAPGGRARTSAGGRAGGRSCLPRRSGGASRQSRRACPRPVAAAVIGFSGSRGSCSDVHGSGTTIVSSGPSSGVPRSEIPRSSASACDDGRRPGEDRDGGELAAERSKRVARSVPGRVLTAGGAVTARGPRRPRERTGSRGSGRSGGDGRARSRRR